MHRQIGKLKRLIKQIRERGPNEYHMIPPFTPQEEAARRLEEARANGARVFSLGVPSE